MTANEETVETVARAIFDAANPITAVVHDYWLRVVGGDMTRGAYRAQAAAAIAAMPQSPTEETIKRVEALADADDERARVCRFAAMRAKTIGEVHYYEQIAEVAEQSRDRLRAALAPPAPACTYDRVDQPATYHFQGCPAVYPPLASPAPAPHGEEGQR